MAVARILLIDDDRFVSEVLEQSFHEYLGADIEIASSGTLGAGMIRRGNFALVLIDATLPDISGFELATLAAGHDLPVVLTSGHPEVILKLRDFAYPFLAKPFRLDRLLAVSAQAIADGARNVGAVRAAGARRQAAVEAVQAAMVMTADG